MLKQLLRIILLSIDMPWIIDENDPIWADINNNTFINENDNRLDSIYTRYGDTPLHIMARLDYDWIISHKSIGLVYDNEGNTPLHLLAFYGKNCALNHSGFLSLKNKYNRTPYDMWKMCGHRKLSCAELAGLR